MKTKKKKVENLEQILWKMTQQESNLVSWFEICMKKKETVSDTVFKEMIVNQADSWLQKQTLFWCLKILSKPLKMMKHWPKQTDPV